MDDVCESIKNGRSGSAAIGCAAAGYVLGVRSLKELDVENMSPIVVLV